MRKMTAEKAGIQILQAYGTWATQGNGGWMRITEVFDRTDLSHPEATAGIQHLSRTRQINAAMDPARHQYSDEERACEVPLGPDLIGLITR